MSKLVKPNPRVHPKPTRHKNQAAINTHIILWQPPPALALSPVRSQEAIDGVDHLALDLLMSHYSKQQPNTNKFYAIFYHQKQNPRIQELIYQTYSDFKEYYSFRISNNKQINLQHLEYTNKLQKYADPNTIQSIEKLWDNPIEINSTVSYQACQDRSIQIQPDRLSILYLGRPILGQIKISDPNLTRIYPISQDPQRKSYQAVAIHALQSNGQADLTLNTDLGMEQFQISINPNQTQDLVCDPTHNPIQTIKLQMNYYDSIFITNNFFFSDYILGTHKSNIELSHIKDLKDPEFFKSFLISSKAEASNLDLIIPTTHQIYKLQIQIKDSNNANPNSINLSSHL